jgi:preprotein translocase subunit SecF
MQFIKPDININFVGMRKLAFVVSLPIIIISIASLIYHKGPSLGIDFAGGTLIQVKFFSETTVDRVKDGLDAIGVDASSVQQFGNKNDFEYLIRTDSALTANEGFAGQLQETLAAAAETEVEIRRVEMVGPQVGKDLQEKALLAMFYALLFITIYISWRFELKLLLSGGMSLALIAAVYIFNLFDVSIPLLIAVAFIVALVLFWFLQLKYAMGAIVALMHDVLITVGIFSLFDKEFTLPIIAALLTIIGYSLNDTIIVFVRIRENLKKYQKNPLEFIVNRSINETLSRTILTSVTTLIVVVTLFILGGGIIHDFAFALIIGVLVGTYSSIFVASPILLAWQNQTKT